jgi:glycosyltransferase involved in cell wall biosynthesis
MAGLLADAGETVHVIAQRWDGAPAAVSETCSGRLVVHRVSLEQPAGPTADAAEARLLRGLLESDCPLQAFAWQAARVAERLVSSQKIDIIEAQEWEAPLYYFLVRRALGMGPRRRPPCLVHLHSPSELIVRHNGWNPDFADLRVLRELEAYTIRAADALICPSRYLAREAERLFGLLPETVMVTPYPLGDAPALSRPPSVWSRDRICYVGRLELRKGVLEWVDAGVTVAQRRRSVEFEFIGSDTSLDGEAGASVQAALVRRIPRALRKRFRFRGSQSKEGLRRILSAASAAVVPSRWENLPYTCIEAMSTGMPVLVSPNGGMAELVSDGRSGWVARDASPGALAVALERFLDTPPEQRATMGHEAEAAVRRICGSRTVLARHLELRQRIAVAGAGRSMALPPGPEAHSVVGARHGTGVVLTCLERPELISECVASIAAQQRAARVSVVVVDERFRERTRALFQNSGLDVLYVSTGLPLEDARRAGAEALLAAAPDLRGIAFASEGVRLYPQCLDVFDAALERQPAIGRLFSLNVPAHSFFVASASAWLTGAGAALQYPGELVFTVDSRSTAAVRAPCSVLALAQRGPGALGLDWFLAAPASEKLRAIAHAAVRPGRAARWLAWQARGLARRAQAAG